jgi:pimeloyl-ACP methyl ester carboxylesterase
MNARTGVDHYADGLAAVVNHLDLHDAIHVGHSTGGGEVTRYIGRHGESRVARAVLISAVPPIMVQTDKNPQGTPKKVFDDFQAQLAANRPGFTGLSRPGRSMASTGRASSRRRPSSRTGGARA